MLDMFFFLENLAFYLILMTVNIGQNKIGS